jgi:hypothetical protein
MSVIPINSFGGISQDIANPPIGSAQSCYGLVRNRNRGHLELPDGYATKFAIPVSDTYTTAIVGKDIANFYVAEHGGKSVTVFVGTYTKVSRYSSGVTIPRFGVWMRPYWSGSAWIDSWLELTEIEIVQLTSASSTSTLNFTDTGAAADYYKNWTVVFEDFTQANDVDNYFLVQSSTSSSVTYFGANASITTAARTTAGEKIILCRSFLNKELPSSISSYIFNYLNEIRMTSGNNSTDVSLMAGFRTKPYSWATSDASIDRIVLDVGCLDTWRYAVGMDFISAVVDSSSPLPAGNYTFKAAIGTDDNQIAVAREAYIGAISALASKYSVTSALSKIAISGNYIYRADVDNKRIINKYNLADYTFVAAIQISTASDYRFDEIITLGDSIYVMYNVPNGDNYEYFAKINISTFTLTSTTEITQWLTNKASASPQCTTDGTYLYIFDTIQFTAAYWRMSKYDTTMNVVTTSHGAVGYSDEAYANAIGYSGGYVFAAVHAAGNNSHWFKFLASDISLSINKDIGATDDYPSISPLCVIGSYIYGIQKVTTATGIFVEKRNVSDLELVSQLSLTTATDGILVTNGTSLYAYIDYNGSRVIMKELDVAASSTDNPSYSSELSITNTTENMAFSTYLYGDGFIIDTNPTTYSIASDGTKRIDFKLLVSAGAIPKRMKYVYIYVSKDGAAFYRLFKRDLTVVTDISTGIVTEETWDAAAYYNATAKHFYHRSATISIRESDYEAIGAEITVDMGRTYVQSGVVRYSAGNIIGVKSYVGNFYDVYSGQTFKNSLLVNCISGDGNQQIDVFDYLNPQNLEYGDGDSIAAITDSNERILVLKKRSSILETMNNDATYQREVASRGIGCCSQGSVVSYDDIVYWADYNGIYSFASHSGVELINPTWSVAWRTYSTAQREASLFVIDRVNEALLVCVGSDIWQYDLGRREIQVENEQAYQWVQLGYTDIPTAIKQNSDGTIDFLIAKTDVITGKILTISSTADRFNATNYSFKWKSNQLEVLQLEKAMTYDALILGFIISYTTTFAFSLSLYLDDSSTAIKTAVLPSGTHKVQVLAPLGSRCKAPVVEITGTTATTSDAIEIKFLHTYMQPIESGDILVR